MLPGRSKRFSQPINRNIDHSLCRITFRSSHGRLILLIKVKYGDVQLKIVFVVSLKTILKTTKMLPKFGCFQSQMYHFGFEHS